MAIEKENFYLFIPQLRPFSFVLFFYLIRLLIIVRSLVIKRKSRVKFNVAGSSKIRSLGVKNII